MKEVLEASIESISKHVCDLSVELSGSYHVDGSDIKSAIIFSGDNKLTKDGEEYQGCFSSATVRESPNSVKATSTLFLCSHFQSLFSLGGLTIKKFQS